MKSQGTELEAIAPLAALLPWLATTAALHRASDRAIVNLGVMSGHTGRHYERCCLAVRGGKKNRTDNGRRKAVSLAHSDHCTTSVSAWKAVT